jgi:hypothetical protein
MMDMEVKVLFEVTKEGKATIQVNGHKASVKAGVLTLIERMAELEGSSTAELLSEFQEINKMKQQNPIEDILAMIFGFDNEDMMDDDGGCDGDCENCMNHEEMPQEVKDLFDKMFGGNN